MNNPYGFGAPPKDNDDRVTVRNMRCDKCDKLLAELITSPYQIRCSRCKKVNVKAPDTVGTDK